MSFWRRFLGGGRSSASALTSSDLERLLRTGGRSRSGVPVSWETALDVSTVLACCRVIANGVAQVPFRVYRDDGANREVAKDHPLNALIYRRPNRWQTSYEFRETIMFHALLTGNAYVFVNRVGTARDVYELIPLEPGRVSVKQNSDLSLEYTVSGARPAREVFGQDAIWHLRGPSWDSWRGLDTIKLARDAIGLSMALEQSQSDFQRNGAQTSGVLSVSGKLSPERFAFLSAWLDKHEPGGERFQKPLIVDDGTKYTSNTMTGVDQQLIETRKHQIEDICRAFGVMPIMVGHADKTATYASAEQMFLAHVVHTLAPWYQRIEQSADVNLLSEQELRDGYYTKFVPNALMRGAAADRASFYSQALGSGGHPAWMTANEVRALEEMDRIEGGDDLAKPATPGAGSPDDADEGGADEA